MEGNTTEVLSAENTDLDSDTIAVEGGGFDSDRSPHRVVYSDAEVSRLRFPRKMYAE